MELWKQLMKGENELKSKEKQSKKKEENKN